MIEESSELKAKGFEIYRTNQVKRLTSTHFLVPNSMGTGSFLVEIQEGNWVCDCHPKMKDCEHRFAAQLASAAIRPLSNDNEEQELKCRYCGSPDLTRCGFRYNAYGIAHRFKCNECLRKFSIKYIGSILADRTGPSEYLWLLSEIGMVLTKLQDLIAKGLVDPVTSPTRLVQESDEQTQGSD